MASSSNLKSIAIFASGSGSNALRIMQYFEEQSDISIGLVLTNNETAGVIDKAKSFGIPTEIISNQQSKKGLFLSKLLESYQIDFIVLAGYLRLIPAKLIEAFPEKIVNIHPALLPKYGGKGMYGHHVHEAVKANQESESGMTIHMVSEKYDEGETVFQGKCNILESDDADQIAAKVLRLEHIYFAPIIEQIVYFK